MRKVLVRRQRSKVNIKWSKEKVLSELKLRHSKNLSLCSETVYQEDNKLYKAVYRIFGTWTAVIKKLGLDPNTYIEQQKWSRRRILSEMRDRRDSGKSLFPQDVLKDSPLLYNAIYKYYRDWHNMLAKVDPTLKIHDRIIWSPELVRRKIKRRLKNRQRLNHASVDKEDPRLGSAARRYFDTYESAVLAAGLDYNKIRLHKFWSEEEILVQVKQMYDSGLPINSKYINENFQAMHAQIYKLFSTYESFLEKLGFAPEAIYLNIKWNPEKVIQEIQNRVADSLPISYRKVEIDYPSLSSAAKYYFGNYGEAVEAAGFNYDAVILVWNTKRKLPKLKQYCA